MQYCFWRIQYMNNPSCSYIKLWDTETGQVKMRFTTNKIPYCLRYNPDADKSHLFLSGMQDKKIICVSSNSPRAFWKYYHAVGHALG